ncbi:MAG: hypothetical protein AMXMBFR46_27810 [Acidimicrobiia bacterium]
MTTTATDAPVAHDDAAQPELRWIPLSALVAHPDNPRTHLGDLTELTRSIRAVGIRDALTVLPANADGIYTVVDGHRRLAAGTKAGAHMAPAVVRDLTPLEVIESMLTENVHREDLTVAEEVRAIEKIMSLDEGVTPAKLCKRLGKSQTWIRSRMAVTILPARWRSALDRGELTLAAAEAAASAADLGPEHLDAVCEHLSRQGWGDPGRAVATYRDDLRRAEAYATAVEKAKAKHAVVFTDDDPAPDKAKRLGELFDTEGSKAHKSEPCHAIVLRRKSWGDGHDTFDVCTDPRRHTPSRVGTATGSDLASDRATRRPSGSGDDSHAKRKARLARVAHATETFAKARGGISQADLTRVALRGLIFEAGREAIGYAATFLGYEQPRDVTARELLDGVETPAALARVAGAVALGIAETHMYWSATSPPCRDYLDVLTGSGWEPDPWTADALTRNPDSDTWDHPDDGESDDGSEDGHDENNDEPDVDPA